MATSRTFPLFPSLPAVAEEQKRKSVPPRLAPGGGRPLNPAWFNRPAARQLWLAIHLSELRTHDERRARQLLERIAVWAHRFTPIVSLEPPNELLLEVRGSLHLFGGAQSLCEFVVKHLGAASIAIRCALTSTPTASLWLARGQGEGVFTILMHDVDLPHRLGQLPLTCLCWPQERIEELMRMGTRTIGDLLRLPRAGFARRIGAEALLTLDRALGHLPEPRQAFRIPQRYEDIFAPEVEIDNTQWLEAFIGSRLDRLQRFLRERQAAATAFRLELRHRVGEATRLRIAFTAPCSDVEHLRELLRERLATLRLPEPVIGIRLRSAPLLTREGFSAALPLHDLLPMRPHFGDALMRTVERLRARLGHEALFTPRLIEDHRPELAWRMATNKEDADAASWQPNAPGSRLCRSTRPLWLLRKPKSLSLCDASNRFAEHRPEGLQFEQGPERIETGWWDGQEVMRDYFVARAESGARLWVYRERRPPYGWYLHGLFG